MSNIVKYSTDNCYGTKMQHHLSILAMHKGSFHVGTSELSDGKQ